MVTDKELLAAAEACKHFKQIIKGCEIEIHTDLQNLVYDEAHHASMRVLLMHLLLVEEYWAKFVPRQLMRQNIFLQVTTSINTGTISSLLIWGLSSTNKNLTRNLRNRSQTSTPVCLI